MNISHKLFQIIDDEPVYTPVVINIKCFKELYMKDKTEDKSKFAKQLLYIWYIRDGRSPYFMSAEKEKDASMEVFGKVISHTKLLQQCIDEYDKRQSTPIIRAYNSVKIASDNMSTNLTNGTSQVREYERLVADIDELLASLGKDPEDIEARLDLMDRRASLEKAMIDRSKGFASLVQNIEKQVQSLETLKKAVDKEIMSVDSDDNKEAISNFLIDEFIKQHEV